ncbi:major facilitator superfamily domain-containing protein [Immersiella caudata]|uniref:Major facilitator superfamily domain-containing protein n=1 Tax=Immersiella caudata TaxID=314043 RepID=A0AA39WYI4_9PEZI|nr:major facilitator superfamily domain-containing protein [Immersiella caudata]
MAPPTPNDCRSGCYGSCNDLAPNDLVPTASPSPLASPSSPLLPPCRPSPSSEPFKAKTLLSGPQTAALILSLSLVTFSASFSNGLLTVGLPNIAADLQLPSHLLLWPSSSYSLTCGCCMLLFGAVADHLSPPESESDGSNESDYESVSDATSGSSTVQQQWQQQQQQHNGKAPTAVVAGADTTINILGTALVFVFVLAQSLAQNGGQLILFRALQGIGTSMCLPTGVSIVTRRLPPGRARNMGFATMGVAQPLGFSAGMVLEGALEETLGSWRVGYYVCAGVLGVLVVANWYNLRRGTSLNRPGKDTRMHGKKVQVWWRSLASGIDWTGLAISSAGLGLVSYASAIITEDPTRLVWDPLQATIPLVLGIALIALVFPLWLRHRDRHGLPALIPKAVWHDNTAFVAISAMVLLAWAAYQSGELLLSLFFQRVQHASPVEASWWLLPNVVVGLVLNPLTGLFVQHFAAHRLLAVVSLMSALSPLIMVCIDPAWPWWAAAFWAVALGPVSVDVLFTMAHMVITSVFPPEMHSLAGAVFNAVAQLGTSLGMSLVAVVSAAVTRLLGGEGGRGGLEGGDGAQASLAGYRAAFATCFVLMILSAGAALGLRDVGRLGAPKKN